MSRKPLCLVGFCFALALGCASAPSRNGPIPDPATPGATVVVHNHYPADMAIYVVNASGGQTRIGTVLNASRGRLVIPTHLFTQPGLRLLAKEIGPGAGYMFPSIPLEPSASLDVVLERNLNYSTISVR